MNPPNARDEERRTTTLRGRASGQAFPQHRGDETQSLPNDIATLNPDSNCEFPSPAELVSASAEEIEANESRAELSWLFDRYSAAMDRGDTAGAQAVLDEYPELAQEFGGHLLGLYLLEKGGLEETVPPTTASPSLRRLGDFEIEHELGRGGMGVVYAARQISLQRPVALKILPFAAVLDPRQVTRFRNEAQAAASLHHPHIVPVYGFGCERGVHYYSMQLIEGQSLDVFLADLRSARATAAPREPVPPMSRLPWSTRRASQTTPVISTNTYLRKVINWGIQAATAIHYAHEQGIVHRDLKPSNLLLDELGAVYVTDFGLARCAGLSGLTSQGEQLGTWRYMSPEQALGRVHEVDFRTDIFSLGVTLYELLTLELPFAGESREELRQALAQQSPRPMTRWNPAIPTDLETILWRALARSPGDRYSSAAELADDLRRQLAGQPIRARRPTFGERCWAGLRRHQRVVLGVLLVSLVTCVALARWAQRERDLRAGAEQAHLQSREYLRAANQTVERFATMINEHLPVAPESAAVRAEVWDSTVAYYQDVVRQVPSTLEGQRDQAAAWAALARLWESAGDVGEARAALHQALQQWTALRASADSEPYPGETEIARALCWDHWGRLELQRGSAAEALAAWREAVATWQALPAAVQDEPMIRAATAQSLANLASRLFVSGDETAAAELWAKAHQRLAVAPPGTDNLLHRSVKCQIAVQQALCRATSNAAATSAEDEASRLCGLADDLRELTELPDENYSRAFAELPTAPWISYLWSHPQSLQRQNHEHLADLRNNLAVALSRVSRLPEARKVAEQAVAFWQGRHELRANDLRATLHWATAANTLGEVHLSLGDAQAADQEFSRSQELLVTLVAAAPLPDHCSRLASVCHNRGILAQTRGAHRVARQHLEDARHWQTQALEQAPTESLYQQRLKQHVAALANLPAGVSLPTEPPGTTPFGPSDRGEF